MRYERYKEVDLPWLQEVPEHWELVRNKHVLIPQKRIVGDNFSDYVLLSLTLRGIIERDIESGKGKFPESFEKYKVVNRDDLIFCLFDIDETPRTVGISKNEGMITGAYDVYKSLNSNPNFLAYYWIKVDNEKALKPYYKSLRKTITSDSFLSIRMPLPPLHEQEQIANFLDWKINEIDRLILIEKEKIKLFNQPLQMFIDSRYEILNLDDKSCDGTKIKYLANQITRRDNECRRYIALENVISQKGVMNISFDELEFNNDGISAEKNMVIFGKLRPYLAKSIIVEDKAICSSEFLVLDPIKVTPEYLKYLMLSSKFIDLVNSSTYGTKMPRANSEFILNLKVIVPDLAEQRNVVEIILESEDRINKAIETILSKIKSMEDLKQTLISEVVTGRIDIRNIDIPEYEKVESVFEEDEDQVEGGEDEWD